METRPLSPILDTSPLYKGGNTFFSFVQEITQRTLAGHGAGHFLKRIPGAPAFAVPEDGELVLPEHLSAQGEEQYAAWYQSALERYDA